MKRYSPKDIEPKWQQLWEQQGIYHATEDSDKPKRYVLEYFPYPSGAAMHVGHVRNYTIGDAMARFWRMQGYNVLHPMGWDAFGLPAENYAIKTGISPRQAIDQNTGRFKQQLMQMGFSHDWSREIDSTDPGYYKWTQWFFLMLFKKGLAYQQESLQWWCPHDKTVLANEQVEAGKCWRCGNEVERKALKQWFFKITDYGDRLLDDLNDLDWSDSIKSMQRNWIGRSRGAEITFKVSDSDEEVKVFTTRHDTQYGVTFLVLAPENSLVKKITQPENSEAVDEYVKQAVRKTDIQRQEEGDDKDKTGVFTGSYVINPINDEKIPVWVADYVLMGYGTGAVMGVPGHDSRDKIFAEKYDLEIRKVYTNDSGEDYHSEGEIINSDKFNGLRTEEAREKILDHMVQAGYADEKVNYKMRDWLISRQRYWGAPIPIVHCPKDGAVAVPEDQLPVELPELTKFEPSGDGRSPLANVKEFVNTTCPQCGGPAERETDTMDGFACSSWYFLRFADPANDQEPFDKAKAKFWLPVDDYIGGAEHAVMHLLYARFWTKVMFDEGLIDFQEPFKALRNQGMILAPDGQKMSKSKGNTIEPGELIDQGYGADSIRIMELFIGPWNQAANWSVEGIGGAFRFLQRIWTLVQEHLEAPATTDDSQAKELQRATHAIAKRVTLDLREMSFNTAIAGLMEHVNELYKLKTMMPLGSEQWQEALETLVQLTAPLTPHIAEELWEQLGDRGSIHISDWPTWDEDLLVAETVKIAVQVNGKVRGELELPAGVSEAEVIQAALADEKVKTYVTGDPKKTIYIDGKLLSIVV